MAVGTSMSSMRLPKGYGLTLIPFALSIFVNFFMLLLVVRARHKYGVKYPNLYATPGSADADAFNRTQRTHQNTLEYYSITMILMFVVGLRFPVEAAAAGCCWVFGRFLYALGYPLSAELRIPGVLISFAGMFALSGMVCYMAYEAGTDRRTDVLLNDFFGRWVSKVNKFVQAFAAPE